jgi:hypothetical protein
VKHAWLAVGGALLGLLPGCGDSTTSPDLGGGAGIRLELPAGADTLAWIRVGLWNLGTVSPPDCPAVSSAGGARGSRITLVAEEDPPFDVCTRMRVSITDFAGAQVLLLADTPYTDLAFPWDGKDDLGDSVPSGIYPIRSSCLDSRGQYSYKGQYYVLRDEDRGECAWPLWLKRYEPAPVSRTLTLSRFPLVGETQAGTPLKQVAFLNPFLVRVDAPGMERFEAEVSLAADTVSRVRVTLVSAAGAGPAGAGAQEGTRTR